MSSLHERLGQEALHQLVERFYDIMDELPEARPIRDMHPADLASSREKLFLFLVGWSGGPPLYVERYGHPRLRARHLPFPIGDAERDQWLECMRRALDDCVSDAALRVGLFDSLARVADHMRNQGPA